VSTRASYTQLNGQLFIFCNKTPLALPLQDFRFWTSELLVRKHWHWWSSCMSVQTGTEANRVLTYFISHGQTQALNLIESCFLDCCYTTFGCLEMSERTLWYRSRSTKFLCICQAWLPHIFIW